MSKWLLFWLCTHQSGVDKLMLEGGNLLINLFFFHILRCCQLVGRSSRPWLCLEPDSLYMDRIAVGELRFILLMLLFS